MTHLVSSVGRRHAHRGSARGRGFSLVELMVAVVLGLFLVIGLISLITSNTRTRAEFDKSSRQIENGRFALQLLTEDFQHAGLLGKLSRGPFDQVLPTPCAATVADLAYTGVALPAVSSVPTSIYGPTATPGCVSNVKANTAIVVITRSSTSESTTLTAGEAYLQVSSCQTELKPFVIAAATGTTVSSASYPLTTKDCATLAPVRKVVQRIYFVSTCNVCSGAGADTVPTLKMAEYVAGSMTITALVEGIENLQVDYGIDMNSDGSPDCYTSNPSNPPSAEITTAICPQTSPVYDWTVNPANTLKNWSNVVSARIHVLARNNETSAGWNDTRTYDMGLAAGTVGPFNDATKRHVFSAVARLYNISGQRETP